MLCIYLTFRNVEFAIAIYDYASLQDWGHILSAVCARCRDQDIYIRATAFKTLHLVPMERLKDELTPADWRQVIEQGLQDGRAADGGIPCKRAKEVYTYAKQLFVQYLEQDGGAGLPRRLQELLDASDALPTEAFHAAVDEVACGDTFAAWLEAAILARSMAANGEDAFTS